MKTYEISLARIGNSRGIRIPAHLIRKYGFEAGILLEDRGNVVMLTSQSPPETKLSWEETAKQMVDANEDWSDWESTLPDGMEDIPWKNAEAVTLAVREDPPQKRRAKKPKSQ